MNTKMKFKRVIAGLACAGALALSANAQAFSVDVGLIGDVGNKTIVDVNQTSGFFLDTINFDLGTTFTHFNMTSSTNLASFNGASIFENELDGQVVASALTHTSVFLPLLNVLDNLGNPISDYHLHPSGNGQAGGTYQLALWGSSTAPVPLPAAAWLFGSGVIGLIGFARRKMNAKA